MIRAIILLFIAAVYVHCETCDFEPFHQCVKSGFPRPTPKPEDKSKRDAKKAQFDKCFKDAGCQVPQPKEKGADKSKFEQAANCSKQVLEKVRNDIQQCVQQKVPTFKFPAEKEHHEGGRIGHNHGHHEHHGEGEFFGKLINSSCSTETSKSAVKTCLKALEPAKNSTGHKKPDFKALKQQICQKKIECLQKLTPTCQKQLNDTKVAVCDCANEKIKPQSAQIEASLKLCRPKKSSENGGSDENTEKNHPKHIGGSTRKPGSKIDHFIDMFCEKDACK